MSIVLHGVAVGAGVAIGRAHLVVRGMDDVPHRELSLEELPEEIARYEQAIKTTRRQLEQLRADIPENAHPRGTANPTKCAQGETLRNCRVYRSWTSTRAIPPSLLLPSLFSSFSLQMKSRYRCTKPGWIVRRKCG